MTTANFSGATPRDRATSLVAAGAVTLAMGWALVTGLGVSLPQAAQSALEVFQVLPAPPPPPEERVIPDPKPNRRPEARAAPPNIRSTPTEIVSPPPVVKLPVPPVVVTAPVADQGAAPTAGAADRVGPGTGSGGEGDGRGGGGDGDGDGGGWRDETPPRQIGGRLSIRDLPRDIWENTNGGVVEVLFLVETNGRVADCKIARSSGIPRLDALTCSLIRQRYRFRPSLDGRGRPVPAWIRQSEGWEFEGIFR